MLIFRSAFKSVKSHTYIDTIQVVIIDTMIIKYFIVKSFNTYLYPWIYLKINTPDVLPHIFQINKLPNLKYEAKLVLKELKVKASFTYLCYLP